MNKLPKANIAIIGVVIAQIGGFIFWGANILRDISDNSEKIDMLLEVLVETEDDLMLVDEKLQEDLVDKVFRHVMKDSFSVVLLVGLMFYQNWKLASFAIFMIPLAGGLAKNLGKQVAKATHPDKHEGTMLDFKAASSAYQSGDWAMLLQIAEEHNIMPEDLSEVLPVMKEEAKRLKETIEYNKTMYSWMFQECETEQCKENLVKKFLKQLFKVEL